MSSPRPLPHDPDVCAPASPDHPKRANDGSASDDGGNGRTAVLPRPKVAPNLAGRPEHLSSELGAVLAVGTAALDCFSSILYDAASGRAPFGHRPGSLPAPRPPVTGKSGRRARSARVSLEHDAIHRGFQWVPRARSPRIARRSRRAGRRDDRAAANPRLSLSQGGSHGRRAGSSMSFLPTWVRPRGTGYPNCHERKFVPGDTCSPIRLRVAKNE